MSGRPHVPTVGISGYQPLPQYRFGFLNLSSPQPPRPKKKKMGQLFSSPARPATLPQKSEAGSSSSETLPEYSKPAVISADSISVLTTAKGHYWYPSNGRRVLDACGGAGVACIGHGREEVIKAATAQMKACSYVSYAHFKTTAVQNLSDWLIESTGGAMQKVYLMCSGKPPLSLLRHHTTPSSE